MSRNLSETEYRDRTPKDEHAWWRDAVVYQVYPRSFQDANSDGVGDLRGVTQRLDYLQRLGVGAIWLSPFYCSPMRDFGYDTSNHCAVDPIFGTMEDFDELVSEAQHRNLRVILDLVPNHTSDLHPWFWESRKSKDSPRRHWYIWADGKGDALPPNNWLSCFGGSAWAFDEATGQHYLHTFSVNQPDLNYREPDVIRALHQTMHFWLSRGIDGFRVDVIEFMAKDRLLRDNPNNREWDGKDPYYSLIPKFTKDMEEVHSIIKSMRAVMAEYGPDKLLIGEVFLPPEKLVRYHGQDDDECQLPFNFGLIYASWNATSVASLIERYERALPEGAWPNWVLGNHDQHRIASRLGFAQARVAAVLLLTLRGTPTWYYGDELGMPDGKLAPKHIRDPAALNQPDYAEVLGRDPARLPMPWTRHEKYAGFSGGLSEPWLPMPEDSENLCVEAQWEQPLSMLNLFSELVSLRNALVCLRRGSLHFLEHGEEWLSFIRSYAHESCLVVLNLTKEPVVALPQGIEARAARVLCSTIETPALPNEEGRLSLKPNEATVFALHTQP